MELDLLQQHQQHHHQEATHAPPSLSSMEPCVMPPPPSRPWSRLADAGDAQEADPHARPVVAMHVSVGPREPSAVVLFDIDARRPLTCISLPTALRLGARWGAHGRAAVHINGRAHSVEILSAVDSTIRADTLGADVLGRHAGDPQLADPAALFMR
ncbi:hypothetical protein pkur_cds_184 [Pandoravirus kuranda]|uniref:Uncharacterized protein n=1 Tax=Pandoravirus kuranda TaxID=3019033 RepID=A0AA95EDI1_9VIRU|nr:hypothetical protein pkur_cds_184 [Pandoravirus kuranda]